MLGPYEPVASLNPVNKKYGAITALHQVQMDGSRAAHVAALVAFAAGFLTLAWRGFTREDVKVNG